MNIALFRKRIDESVIARTQSEAKGKKQSGPKGHSEHICFVQCKLHEESQRGCAACPEH